MAKIDKKSKNNPKLNNLKELENSLIKLLSPELNKKSKQKPIRKEILDRLKEKSLESEKAQEQKIPASDENEQEPSSIPDFSDRFSDSIINSPSRINVSPVLQASNQETQTTNLEQDLSNIPNTNQPSIGTNADKTPVYVMNAPDYASSVESFNRGVYEKMEEAGRTMNNDNQLDITSGMLLHRTPQATLQDTRAMNLGVWQRDNVFSEWADDSQLGAEPERRYQVGRAKQKKDDSKLPFQ